MTDEWRNHSYDNTIESWTKKPSMSGDFIKIKAFPRKLGYVVETQIGKDFQNPDIFYRYFKNIESVHQMVEKLKDHPGIPYNWIKDSRHRIKKELIEIEQNYFGREEYKSKRVGKKKYHFLKKDESVLVGLDLDMAGTSYVFGYGWYDWLEDDTPADVITQEVDSPMYAIKMVQDILNEIDKMEDQ